MKNSLTNTILFGLVASAIACAPLTSRAQEDKKGKGEEKSGAAAGEKSDRPIPFRGKIDSVDKTAKTVKVGERVFKVTSDTRIRKGGQDATLDDAVAGEDIGGSYRRATDGTLNAVSLRFGPRPEGDSAGGSGGKKKKGEDE